MFDFYIIYRNCAAFVVSAISLEAAANAFPTADVIDFTNLSNRIIRSEV